VGERGARGVPGRHGSSHRAGDSRREDESPESDRLKGLHYGLIDLTDVAELRVTRDDVLEFMQVDMQIALIVPRALAVAIVAPSDLAFGIARMWEAFAEVTRWNTHVFRSRADADPWLRPWAEGRLPAEPPA
jgi:hypothetical protein